MHTPTATQRALEERLKRFREVSAEQLLELLQRTLILTALFIFLLSLMTGQQMRAAVTLVVLLSAVGSMYGVYRTRQDQQGQQDHQSEQSQQHDTRHATRHLKRLLLAISVALTAGTLFNGGVHAPGFIAFFVLFTLHVWISTTERVYGALVLFAMLGVSAIKMTELELVPTIEPPSPYYLLTLYTCFLFLIIRVLFSIKTLLFQSLGEVGHNQILLEGLFESSRDGLLICKPDLSIHRANQEAQELIDTLQAQGATLSTLAVLWRRKSTTLGALLSSLQGDVPPINITLNKRSLELTSTPLVLDDTLAGYVITTRDVTELLIQRKRAQQADKMDAIGHVTSSIAHDFNNHITALKGSIECLADYPTPEQAEWLEMMRLSADQASDLVSQLLSFARDDPESIQTVSLSATLNKAIPLIKGALHKGVQLYIEIPKELNSLHNDLVLINPNALINVFVNLSVNASHAMPQGGELRFTLSYTGPQEPSEAHLLSTLNFAHAEHLTLCVEDTGTGIKPEVIEHIFEPFFTTKKEGEGTGLGLASAYQLMRRSGGLIVAESEIEVGARFTLYFPLARPRSTSAHQAQSHIKNKTH